MTLVLVYDVSKMGDFNFDKIFYAGWVYIIKLLTRLRYLILSFFFVKIELFYNRWLTTSYHQKADKYIFWMKHNILFILLNKKIKPGHNFPKPSTYYVNTNTLSLYSPDDPGVVGAAVGATHGLELLAHWPLQQERPGAQGPFWIKQSNVNKKITPNGSRFKVSSFGNLRRFFDIDKIDILQTGRNNLGIFFSHI